MSHKRTKVQFTGSQGTALAGMLESPKAQPKAWVLFAHCFTCGKDIAAASRIARALVSLDYAVLRFDFTGLGNSDGDFANTNFSSNVQDLIKAAEFLREEYAPPALLIGHSLGGTAVLKAAHELPEVRGVVTIGSPANAAHVAKQFSCDIEHINAEGQAKVNLAGREFTIKKQFIDDIAENSNSHIGDIRKALLVMHSPVDTTVSINEAEHIYTQARHPKSFVSLDNADHLLTRKTDAEYAAQTIAAWSTRFLDQQDPPQNSHRAVADGEVRVSELDHKFTQRIETNSHQWIADEPISVGGKNRGPDPYEHLLAALGSCTAMTMRMYAERKKWPLDDVVVTLSHTRDHGDDCARCSKEHPQIDVINRTINVAGNLSDEQRDRLLQIADKCPVHRTLHNKIEVRTKAA